MVHLDRVKGAEFNTETATHTDGRVDVKFSRSRDGFAGGITVTHNPDTLRRTDFGANPTGCTAIFTSGRIPNEHRNIAKALWQQALLFRILNRQQPFLVDGLLDNTTLIVQLHAIYIAAWHRFAIIGKGVDRMFQGDAQPF